MTRLRAHDTRRNGRLQVEWRADSQHPLAKTQRVGVTEWERRQILTLDLDKSHIGSWVSANQLCIEGATVVEFHLEFGGVLDDMVVGHDVAILRDNHARATRPLLTRLWLTITATTAVRDAEKLIERVVTIGAATHLHLLHCLDVHHRLHRILGGVGQVGILLRLVGSKVVARLRHSLIPRG